MEETLSPEMRRQAKILGIIALVVAAAGSLWVYTITYKATYWEVRFGLPVFAAVVSGLLTLVIGTFIWDALRRFRNSQ
jgi:hypothetical protein